MSRACQGSIGRAVFVSAQEVLIYFFCFKQRRHFSKLFAGMGKLLINKGRRHAATPSCHPLPDCRFLPPDTLLLQVGP